MTVELSFQDEIGAGDQLLELMVETKFIEESVASEISSESISLMESEYQQLLLERTDKTPDQYMFDGRFLVTWPRFHAIWTDYDNYPNAEEVLSAIGIPPSAVSGTTTRPLATLLGHFKSYRADEAADLVKFQARRVAYSKRSKEALTRADAVSIGINNPFKVQTPTRDSIDRGQRRRIDKTSRTLDKINKSEMIPGEFYSDISRIPITTQQRWLGFFEREVRTFMKTQEGKWKKIFVMGYQADSARKAIFEIWFNTLDSSFTIHDLNGVVIGKRYQTLKETLRYYMNQVTAEEIENVPDGDDVINRRRDMLNASFRIAAQTERVIDPYVDQLEQITKNEIEADKAEQLDAQRDKMRERVAAMRKLLSGAAKKAGKTIENAGKASAPTVKSAASASMKAAASGVSMAGRTMVSGLDGLDKAIADQETERQKVNQERIKKERDAMEARIKASAEAEEKRRKEATERREAMNKKYLSELEFIKSERNKPKVAGAVDVNAEKNKLRTIMNQNRKKLVKLNEEFEEEVAYLVENMEHNPDSFLDLDFDEDDTPDEILDQQEKAFASSQYDRHVKRVRSDAFKENKRTKTLAELMDDGMLDVYDDKSRAALRKGFFNGWFGRKKIVLPTDKVSSKFGRGKRYRSDFIVGYSLKDRINVEIWYVTEENTDKSTSKNNKFIASYYVYDVSSGTLIRSHLPYLRNAIRTVMQKIGA